MGKAANRAKAKRRKYLKNIYETNPERFEMEWEGRLSSWLFDITKNAGQLKDRCGWSVPSVFDFVDEAMNILNACGTDAYKKYAGRTHEILTNQCVASLSAKALPRFYRVSRNDRRMYELNV